MRVRLPIITCSLILIVASCGRPDPVANGANAVTGLPAAANQPAPNPAPTPEGAPPTNRTAAPPSTAAAGPAPLIPESLQGRWGLTPADCTSALGDAKGLLVINGREARFYESRAVPSPAAQTSSNSIGGDFHFTGEGQSWTRYEALKRSGDRLTRTETNPAASYTYAKC